MNRFKTDNLTLTLLKLKVITFCQSVIEPNFNFFIKPHTKTNIEKKLFLIITKYNFFIIKKYHKFQSTVNYAATLRGWGQLDLP